jgi:predicted O-methyltransferase YrrM
MTLLPRPLRRLTPNRLRDDVRLRALSVGLGLIPPRTMHSDQDARVLAGAAREARRALEIGVYEGSSAIALCAVLPAGAELHLVDPFGRHPDALPSGWGATEWATRRAVGRAARDADLRVSWHVALSHEVAADWTDAIDLVFIDGDHSQEGCERDWRDWRPFVVPGGHVVFHDARQGRPSGRGLPGPTAVVDRYFRGDGALADWQIAEEADRSVAVRRRAAPQIGALASEFHR